MNTSSPAPAALVVGLGVTGQAVARALRHHGHPVTLVDDRPSAAARAVAAALGLELIEAPTVQQLEEAVRSVEAVFPAPGLPAHHPLFDRAAAAGVAIWSEFDLAGRFDDRPLLAVTGTDGKTTVTTMVCAMVEASGLAARAVGNTDLPLVTAIEDPTVDVFVVEASSFRLAHSQHFAPTVGTWLNFAPDHLDNHRDLDEYEAAKARLWRDQGREQVAIGWRDDPVVARHLARAPGRQVTFGAGSTGRTDTSAAFHPHQDELVTDAGEVICAVSDLPRAFPHDIVNALAASATALYGGASLDGVRAALKNFRGLPHRIALVSEASGVRYFDDSKATTPHAAVAAAAALDSVVLICGGRNKGLDLSVLASAAGSVKAVVAIGEASEEVASVFAGVRPVRTAASMDEAVAAARGLAGPGDAVVLSPGCASFDWYSSYHERGDDFIRAVRGQVTAS